MESVIELLGAGASVAGGGLFGLFGAITGQVSKYFQTKAERVWQEKKWKHEEALYEQQIRLGQAETENEIAIASNKGAWEGLSDSIKADAEAKPQSSWAADIKALFRPFITTLLVICSMYIIWALITGDLDETLTQLQINELIQYSIYSIIFSTATSLAWWFGDRALTPSHLKHR